MKAGLLLLVHVTAAAVVKVTELSRLLPVRGGDAEQRVHLIIGLSATVFMLDFRFCPTHSRDVGVLCVRTCVCECAGKDDDQSANYCTNVLYT